VVHPWEAEDPLRDPIGRHPGRHDWGNSGDDEDSDEDRWDPYSNKQQAAEMFIEELVGIYMSTSISALTFCVLCWWAGLAGMPGMVNTYGLAPGKSTCRYQKHLDPKLSFTTQRKNMYHLNVIGHRKRDLDRSEFVLPVRPPQECIHEELEKDPSISVRLQAAIDEGLLPPSYSSHPVVLNNPGELILPLIIYLDGVAYSLRDSVIGVWIYNMITGRREVIALLRKRVQCKCGCKGWCTWFPILTFLRCCLEDLAAGVLPLCRHDQSPWDAVQDSVRAALGGCVMKMKCCLLRLKGDWAEFW
jgi:hypothetical protein